MSIVSSDVVAILEPGFIPARTEARAGNKRRRAAALSRLGVDILCFAVQKRMRRILEEMAYSIESKKNVYQTRFIIPTSVSPITEYVVRNTWWERYSPVSYKIISRSGNEAEFADMVRRCNNVGVRIYVDVVLRHMGGVSANVPGIGGSYADPAQKYYPAIPYFPRDFLPECGMTGINNPTENRDCSLIGINALAQSTDYVRTKQIELLNKLVDYGVAGFRIDAAQYMWPANLDYIYSHVTSLNVNHGFPAGSRPFFYQEVIDKTGTGPVHSYEYTDIGRVTEFKYGMDLSGCFGGSNALKWLKNFGTEWLLMDSESAVAFIDNHDNQRASAAGDVLTFKKPKEYKFTNADAGPPADGDGNILDVSINGDGGCGGGWTCLPQGTYCDLISGSKSNGMCTGKSVIVSSDGTANVQILSSEDDGVLAITRD
ncbi:Alpha-amylase-related protein, partial [Gryllus bimaculatus]